MALGLGATAHVKYERIYPATINSREEARFAADVAQKLVGQDHVDRNMDPSMGAEDFSFMLQVKPGAYLRLGRALESGMGGCFLHNSRYDFNDEVLPLGPHCMPVWSNRACRWPMTQSRCRNTDFQDLSATPSNKERSMKFNTDPGHSASLGDGRHVCGMAFACGADRAHRQPGRCALHGPALAQRVAAAQRDGQRVRAAGGPRQAT